jgi:excinuclease ABC subunit A
MADIQKQIEVKGAKVHNLKNIDITIDRNRLVVVTGLSGSGKSSFAFDTLYAEGQRRYVESLSSYARQFLGKIHKPEVDYIKGIPPAIAIEQKVNTRNPRSTVGTSTEIYDYIKLLYARIGKTISPVSGKEVSYHSVSDVVDFVMSLPEGERILILSPIKETEREFTLDLETYMKQGYTRVYFNDALQNIDEVLSLKKLPQREQTYLLIDRLVVTKSTETENQVADSVQTSFFEGNGDCYILISPKEGKAHLHSFSNKFEADGIKFEQPSVHMFSFNNPLGACPSCEGFGKVMGIDPDLVIPNKNLSIFQDCVACWKGEKLSEWRDQVVYNADKADFPIHRPYFQLTDAQKKQLWEGNSYFHGINAFFKMVEENLYKVQYRVLLSRFRGKTTCPLCEGKRLKPQASYVKVGGVAIAELVDLPIKELKHFFDNLNLNEHDKVISKRLLIEIQSRIDFLLNVGLHYLTLNRLSATLSGGESQRINLATSLGSSLVGSLYILDEPSIGLHSRDTNLLIGVLKKLQKLGNTVVVVEHDEEIMRAADEIIDFGPDAGVWGGEVVFHGTHDQLITQDKSWTAKYLTGIEKIEIPTKRRSWNNAITVVGARENNLKNIDVTFPLNVFTVVTGVSGSGKSSLIKRILYPAMVKEIGGYGDKMGEFDSLSGDMSQIQHVEFVDQNPIGRSSRSNPVTYSKAYDEIRRLFSEQQASKINGFTPSHFSFNIEGGRCEECEGEGIIKVEMQFMADIELVCESCNGHRFKEDILEVLYNGKSIFDILELSVDEAITFFGASTANLEKKIIEKLKPLQNVGLGYVKLGQPSSTLSGGESQRIKLATFLSGENSGKPTLFIFDEPTTGLHFHDIRKLLLAFNQLIDKGHSVLVIEHNMDVIKTADWIIDLGAEGGDEGGNLVFAGLPEDLITCKESFTGQYLKEKIE